jgi:hypothetical protein
MDPDPIQLQTLFFFSLDQQSWTSMYRNALLLRRKQLFLFLFENSKMPFRGYKGYFELVAVAGVAQGNTVSSTTRTTNLPRFCSYRGDISSISIQALCISFFDTDTVWNQTHNHAFLLGHEIAFDHPFLLR